MAHPSTSMVDLSALLLDAIDQRALAARHALRNAELQSSTAAQACQAAASSLDDIYAAKKAILDALERVQHAGRPRGPSGSAIHRFSRDVLLEIFGWLKLSYSSTSVLDASGPYPIHAVASVCKHWRSVALETSSLWSLVYITFTPDNNAAVLGRLSIALERCRTGHMDTVLISTPVHGWNFDTPLAAMVAKVFARSRRIFLSFGDSTLYFDKSLLPLLMCNMPYLDSLVIAQNDRDPRIYHAHDRSPSVRYLTLCSNLRVLDLDLFPLDCISLEDIPSIEIFRVRTALTLRQLRAMSEAWPALTELCIRGVYRHTSPGTDALPAFPALKMLTCYNEAELITTVLTRAQLPMVDHLQLHVSKVESAHAFLHFIEPSPWMHLCALTLIGRNISLLSRAFRGLPNVRYLCLVRVATMDMQSLFESWLDLMLIGCPRQLRSMKFIACGFGNSVIRYLLNFLTHRKPNDLHFGCPIEDLAIVQESEEMARTDPFPEFLKDRLAQLVPRACITTERRALYHDGI